MSRDRPGRPVTARDDDGSQGHDREGDDPEGDDHDIADKKVARSMVDSSACRGSRRLRGRGRATVEGDEVRVRVAKVGVERDGTPY